MPLSIRIGTWFIGESVDYEEVTVDDTVRALDTSKLAVSNYVWLQAATATMRMTLHGVDPTASFGIRLFDGEQFETVIKTASKLRFIREGASNGLVRAVYYR